MKKTTLVYVGDYGETVIAPETLKAYGVEFLNGAPDKRWRRSSRNRARVRCMYADLAAVQRYFWVRDEDRDKL